MKNILIDLNILLDYYQLIRREKFPNSVKAFEYLKFKDYAFISVSLLDNFEFIMYDSISQKYPNKSRREKLNIIKENIKEFLTFFKIAKTPSYIEIDYDDIEDSQIIASAKAIDAKILTRDKKMLEKHPNITITPTQYTNNQYTNNQYTNQPITNNHPIDFANLKKQHYLYHDEIEKEIDQVLNKTNFIMGEPIKTLEKSLEEFTGAKHAITCSSGTDALLLAMMALDIKPDDEIITTPFTFIATAETIAFLGAKPVFVDIDEKTYNIDPTKIEAAITSKTKAIIPVSLYGQPADMDKINQYTNNQYTNQPIHIIIDGAQSFGATYKNKAEVHYCDIYTTSFFPAKPLGCYGDGGAVFTNDDKLSEKIKSLRVHGQSKRYHHKYIGMGGRLDTIQAAVLNVKLKHYKKDLKLRQEVAKKYTKSLGSKTLVLPYVDKNVTSAFAQYSIRVKNRDELQNKLTNIPITNNHSNKATIPQERGQYTKIPTAVHYPMPLHLQECFEYLGYKEGDFTIAERISKEILSLPMNPYLTDEEMKFITKEIINATNNQYTNNQ